MLFEGTAFKLFLIHYGSIKVCAAKRHSEG